MTEEPKATWLARLCELPFVGEWIATVVGLWPLFLIALLVDMDGVYGACWWLLFSGIAMAPWLILLERWQNLRINVPYLPFKWLWLTPILVILGIACLLDWVS